MAKALAMVREEFDADKSFGYASATAFGNQGAEGPIPPTWSRSILAWREVNEWIAGTFTMQAVERETGHMPAM